MMDSLERILRTEEVQIAAYVGGLHLELLEVLHRHIPGRYGLGDAWGRYNSLSAWVPVGRADNFDYAPIQPPRPECLKVPFWDEGLPPHDLLLWDRPWYSGQLNLIVKRGRKWRPAPNVMLLMRAATVVEVPDGYEAEFLEEHTVLRAKVFQRIPEEEVECFLKLSAATRKMFDERCRDRMEADS